MMMNKLSNKFDSPSSFLMRPVDASTLSAFRILFGAVMVWEVWRFHSRGWIKEIYVDQGFRFNYQFFEWAAPWPGNGMYYHFIIIGLAGLFVAFGMFYRLSAVVLFFAYAYLFLIDQTEYNNHYYFICLLGFLLCFINANNWMSLDNLWGKKFRPGKETGTVPMWHLFILKAQVFIVYFYGGIAKINGDWLRGEPMRHWLIGPAEREGTPQWVAEFLKSEFAAYFFSYGGLLFDLAIGFLLICRKTRLLAIGLLLIFNLINNWLFSIGVFPFLMIGATVLFLEPDTPRNYIERIFSKLKTDRAKSRESKASSPRLASAFVSIYLAIQILLPFRHWLYEGNASWTREGHHFSWRMKLVNKTGFVLYAATNPETGENWLVFPEKILNEWQYKGLYKSPDMILQYAHYLKKEIEKTGVKDPIIKAEAFVSMNFRKAQRLIDLNVDLTQVEYSPFRHNDWILPLKE